MSWAYKSNVSEGYEGTRTQITPPFKSHSKPIENNQKHASSESWSPLTHQEKQYKTVLCRVFENGGLCRFDKACTFAHGFSDLRPVPSHPRYKTKPCRTYHTLGYCFYGARCQFLHGSEEEGVSQLPGYKIKGWLQDCLGAEILTLAANAGITLSSDTNHVLIANLQRLCLLQSQQNRTTYASNQRTSRSDSLHQISDSLIHSFSEPYESSQFPNLDESTSLPHQSSPSQHSCPSIIGSSVSGMFSLDLCEPSDDSGFEPSMNQSFDDLEVGVEMSPDISPKHCPLSSSLATFSESTPAVLGMLDVLLPSAPLTTLPQPHQKSSVCITISQTKNMVTGKLPPIVHPMEVSRGLQLPSISDLCCTW